MLTVALMFGSCVLPGNWIGPREEIRFGGATGDLLHSLNQKDLRNKPDREMRLKYQ